MGVLNKWLSLAGPVPYSKMIENRFSHAVKADAKKKPKFSPTLEEIGGSHYP